MKSWNYFARIYQTTVNNIYIYMHSYLGKPTRLGFDMFGKFFDDLLMFFLVMNDGFYTPNSVVVFQVFCWGMGS